MPLDSELQPDENLDVVRTSRDHESLQLKGFADKPATGSSSLASERIGAHRKASSRASGAAPHRISDPPHDGGRWLITRWPDAQSTTSSHLGANGRVSPLGDLPWQALVQRSRDPEGDAARALVAKGITGKLTILDGKTGQPRTIIDIENTALRTARKDVTPRASVASDVWREPAHV